MLDTRTLQGRLTLAYAGALLLTLFVFAFAALTIVTRSERAVVDTRLARIAGTVSSLAMWHGGAYQRGSVDPARIARLDGTIAESSIFAPDGSVLFTTTPSIPGAVRRLAADPRTVAWSGNVGGGEASWVAHVDPIVREGKTLGFAIAWHDVLPDQAFENRVLSSFALAVPLLALCSLVLGALTARSGLRPLHAMADVVSEIEAHDLSRRIRPDRMPRELARLGDAFNRMLDRLEAAFARERQFTADASHEVRAPLTVIRATAEYALESYREGPEYRRALQSIGLEANDLELLVRDLLSAARADAAVPVAGATVELAAAAFDVVEELYPLARARSITVLRELSQEVHVALDPRAAARIVRAILDNAIRHADEGGHVRVALEAGAREATLVISDDGPGFSEEALRHATERFWRDDPSRARGEGTGLGLAIVDAIVKGAGGRIELRNGPDGGAAVRVTLPLAA
ncbi:MAG TPA: ATP-binding protein [Candidatus Acidoferrum sp.]|nr:ATP-binding protein [Candidatus Acidoferrum sp.]